MTEGTALEKVFKGELVLSTPELRELIDQFEECCKEGELIEIPTEHYFSKDVYAREMSAPKGAIIVGKIHKFQNLNILSAGEVSILSIDGVTRAKAPYTFVASPGSKRVFYIHENATWTTIHGTAEKNIDKIEEIFIAKSYAELDETQVRSEYGLGSSCSRWSIFSWWGALCARWKKCLKGSWSRS